MKFVPQRVEVGVGDTITWTNRDFVPHSITASGAGIESGDLGEGRSFTLVARQKGEIAYICRLHPMMRAVVVIK